MLVITRGSSRFFKTELAQQLAQGGGQTQGLRRFLQLLVDHVTAKPRQKPKKTLENEGLRRGV